MSNGPRPVPDDFIALAPTMGVKACMRQWGVGRITLARWAKEAGVIFAADVAKIRPAPEGFVEAYGSMPIRAMKKAFKCDERTIYRWADEMGLPSVRRARERPVPDDFVTRCTSYSQNGLCSFYNASDTTVKRWLKESGAKARPSTSGYFNGLKAMPPAAADMGLPARAAAFLARERACFPEKTAHDRKTGAWWWGNMRFATADEMVERAVRKGFRVGGEMVG